MADNKKPTDDLLKAMEKFITTKVCCWRTGCGRRYNNPSYG